MLGKIIGRLQDAIETLESEESNLPEEEDEAEREMIDHIVESLSHGAAPRKKRVSFAQT